MCAALGAEVPGHRKQQLTQTLIVRLMKMHFFTRLSRFASVVVDGVLGSLCLAQHP